MKTRETRHKVLLRARMQSEGPYVDVNVRNISSRGMMLESPNPPRVGTYVELFGTVTAVGRVRWIDGNSFGISTQERVNVPLITGRPHEPKGVRQEAVEERQVRATQEAPDRSRRLGRAIDFTIVSLAVVGLGGLFAFLAYGVLSRPLAALGALLK